LLLCCRYFQGKWFSTRGPPTCFVLSTYIFVTLHQPVLWTKSWRLNLTLNFKRIEITRKVQWYELKRITRTVITPVVEGLIRVSVKYLLNYCFCSIKILSILWTCFQ
jgi:hypothetical protein